MGLFTRFTRSGLETLTAPALLLATLFSAGCAATAHRPTADSAAEVVRPPVEQRIVEDPAEDYLAEETAPAPEEAEADLEWHGEELLDSGVLPHDAVLPGEEISESPLDDLAEAPPELDPATLAEERELVARSAPTFNIPIVMNDAVLRWLDYYANRRSEPFRAALARSGRYLAHFNQIYEQEGIPTDLVYMALVESAFKTTAYSRAKARGIFQFMTGTAKMYGLRVDHWVDERLDPEKSARASAQYLRKLYGDFGDWHLVLAAYNAGEGKVRRGLARSGHTDFWSLARTNYLRSETKNHVPAILAATLIAKEPQKYGLEFEPEAPLEYDSIEVEGAADLRILAECAGTDVETMKQLNPALRRYQTPPGATTDVRVPPGTGAQTLAALSEIPLNERVLYASHRVRRGDTLSIIARAYGVSVRAIQSTNNMGRSTVIHEGRTLVIPTAAGMSGRYPAAAPEAEAVAAGSAGELLHYRVRRGDTLFGLARRYATTPAAIAAASGISPGKVLQIGQRLKIAPGVHSADEARQIVRSGRAATRVASTQPSSSGAQTHVVRRGENLSRIASRYGTTVQALCETNGIRADTMLQPGVRLIVRR